MKDIRKIIRQCLNEIQFSGKRQIDFDYLEDLARDLDVLRVDNMGDSLLITINDKNDKIHITNEKIIYDIWPNETFHKLTGTETESEIIELIKKHLPESESTPELDDLLKDLGIEKMNEQSIITKKFANKNIIGPLSNKGYRVKLVGGVEKKGESKNDIDILLTIPKYPAGEKVFKNFEKDLKEMGWNYVFSDEKNDLGIFHNYEKEFNGEFIGLDVFIDEIWETAYTAVAIENEKDIKKLKKLLDAVGGLPEGWSEPENYHMTVALGELPLGLKMRGDLGAEVELEVNSIGISDLAIAAGVTGYISKNIQQHITLAFKDRPADSKEITDWKPLKKSFKIKGVIKEFPQLFENIRKIIRNVLEEEASAFDLKMYRPGIHRKFPGAPDFDMYGTENELGYFTLDETYEIKSDYLSKAINNANKNGAGIENDGKRYIIGAFTYDMINPQLVSLVTSMSKLEAIELINNFKKNEDVGLIIVQKGNDIVSYRQPGNKKWFTKLNEEMKSTEGLALHKSGAMIILYNPRDIFPLLSAFDGDLLSEIAKNVMGIVEIRDNQKYNADEIDRTWAQKGYGPLMYLIAMTEAGNRGLIPNRLNTQITPEAKNVWRNFYEGVGKDYVETTPLIDDEGERATHHEEEYLNTRYIIKNPLDISILEHRDAEVFANDRYGELTSHFEEMADSIIRHKMEDIYGE